MIKSNGKNAPCRYSIFFELIIIPCLISVQYSKALVKMTPPQRRHILIEGQTLSLTCTARGGTNLTWYRDNKIMNIDSLSGFKSTQKMRWQDGSYVTESKLWNEHLRRQDRAIYTCRSGNNEEVSTVVKILAYTTMEPPYDHIYVIAGSRLLIKCTTEDLPGASYAYWQKDNRDLHDGVDGYKIWFNTVNIAKETIATSTLDVLYPNASHSGRYTCMPQPSDYASENSINVTVINATTSIVPSTSPIWTISPRPFSINCTTEDLPNAKPTKWKKNGMDITDGIDGYKIKFSTTLTGSKSVASSTLIVEKSNLKHTGEYECLPQPNVIGAADKLQVKVISVAVYNANITGAATKDHSPIELRCVPESNSAKLDDILRNGHRWTRNGVVLESSSKLIIHPDNYTLIILNPTRKDAGEYLCEFEVDNDTTKKRTVLKKAAHVLTPPVIKYIPESENHAEGDSLEIDCKVLYGHPKPRITWLRDGKVLDPNTDDRIILAEVNYTETAKRVVYKDAILKIYNLKYKDRAYYSCQANNTQGGSSIKMLVRVKG